TTEGRLMAELIGAGALERLSPVDRATAQRLANETLRGMGRADRMLKPYLKKTPPPFVLHALRLGVVELASGAASHGVVNAYVEIVARNKRTSTMKGLTNAVLRKVAADAPTAWAAQPTPKVPGWLREPLVNAWGRDAVKQIEVAQFAGAPLDLSAKGDPVAVAQALGGQVLPTGSIRLREFGQITALPGYDAGDWWVQDAAAALPVKLLGDVADKHIIDLCAAPGGKTLQLAAAGAQVTAVDISARRMARIAENLARLGLQADTLVADAFDVQGAYDAVLLDAPCSATGTMRRHPDLPYAKDGSEFAGLIDQQTRMIDHALTLLRPGGRLVFCTCSLLPDEGEVQVQEALSRHTTLTVDRAELDRPGISTDWVTAESGLRLRPDYWPDLGGMDGFYMAVLAKPT
ncbi:MAG: RsmB/NOP family class I SAM-dependent RNA methyltransferase, partial [Pseudomonadota bacterium]